MINEKDFVVMDAHFGHKNIALHASRMPWIYNNPSYDPLKKFHFKYNNPYAVNLQSHNDAIRDNWNAMVPKKGARVIIGGDFAYNNHKQFIQSLNGDTKIFIMGNHDKANQDFYNVFRDGVIPEDMFDVKKECSSLLKRFRNGDINLEDCRDGIISSTWAKFANLQDWEMADQMSRECLNLFDNVHELGYRTSIQKQDVTFCHYKMASYASSCHGAWHIFGHSHGRMPEFNNVLSCDAGVDIWGYSPVPWCAIVKKMQQKIDWIKENGRYPVDGENKAEGQYSKDFDQRVLDTRAQNKEIIRSLGYPIDDKMWPTEVLKWPNSRAA